MLSDTEKHQQLVEWNDTARAYRTGVLIHELFAEQASRTPDIVAVSHENQSLTYRELDERANQLAHHLRALGVGPDVLVGVCVARCLHMVVSLFGVLKAGGAYVPLDPSYPRERLAYMLEDSGASVLVTQEKLLVDLPVTPAAVLCVDRERTRNADELARPPSATTHEKNLAYVIYTSGSTGAPKGVAIAHESTVTRLHWAKEVFASEELAVVQLSTSICFDLSVYELFVPLAIGGRVVVARDALELLEVKREDLTLINTVPSVMARLVSQGAVPRSVRTVNLAGEPLKAELVNALYATGTVERVYDLYGPTEDTTYSTYGLRHAEGRASIGRPLAETRAYILDDDLALVSPGEVGQLHLTGKGLARGYLGQSARTAEKFVPNPFEVGSRMYRTGDLARWLPDGSLEYLGRIDHQVKIRGFRIELGEIEAALIGAGAREAVVVAREEGSEKRIVAYVVGPAEIATLRAALRAKLPEHMMPSAFVALTSIPLTQNGKIDRNALPAPDRDEARRIVAPRTTLEAVLTRIWESALDRNPISVDADLEEVGATSLSVAAIRAQVERVLGVAISLPAIVRARTVEALARQIGQTRPTTHSLIEVQPGDARRPLFCVHPLFGDVLAYFTLARRLDPRLPIYALQARGVERGSRPSDDIREMARVYVAELREAQPTGPYQIVGYSIGGIIAFEMAQQLRKQGHDVSLLGIFDQRFPDRAYKARALNARTVSASAVLDAILFFFVSNGIALSEERMTALRGRPPDQQPMAAIELGIEQKLLPIGFGVEELSSNMSLHAAHMRALDLYQPEAYPGQIHLFRCEHPDDPPTLGWDRVCGRVEVLPIGGEHHAIFRRPELVGQIADLMGALLDSTRF